MLDRRLRPTGLQPATRHGHRLDNRIEVLELWSRSQPSGQRVTDKLVWAREFMRQYAPHELAENLLL